MKDSVEYACLNGQPIFIQSAYVEAIYEPIQGPGAVYPAGAVCIDMVSGRTHVVRGGLAEVSLKYASGL